MTEGQNSGQPPPEKPAEDDGESADSREHADQLHRLIDRLTGDGPPSPPGAEPPPAPNLREAIHRRMRELDTEESEEPTEEDGPDESGNASDESDP